MTEIKIRTKKGFRLEAKGHANLVESGTDPLCAAISHSIRTLAMCMKLAYQTQLLESEPNMQVSEDNAHIKLFCLPKAKYRGTIAHEFYTIEIGLKLLEEEYPENIKLIIE